jgi:hypothetical protein
MRGRRQRGKELNYKTLLHTLLMTAFVIVTPAHARSNAAPPTPDPIEQERLLIQHAIDGCEPDRVEKLMTSSKALVNDDQVPSVLPHIPGTFLEYAVLNATSLRSQCAVRGDRFAVVRALLSIGADPDLYSGRALYLTTYARDAEGAYEGMKVLLDGGATLGVPAATRWGNPGSPLHVAIRQYSYQGNEKVFADLLTLFQAHGFDFSELDGNQKSLVMAAIQSPANAYKDRTGLVAALLDKGVPLEAEDADGMTAADLSNFGSNGANMIWPRGLAMKQITHNGPNTDYRCMNSRGIPVANAGMARELSSVEAVHALLVAKGAFDRHFDWVVACRFLAEYQW